MISKELMLLCYKNQWIAAYGGTHCWMELCALVPLLLGHVMWKLQGGGSCFVP